MSWCAHNYHRDPTPEIAGLRGDSIPRQRLERSIRMGGWHTHLNHCPHCDEDYRTSCWHSHCLQPLLERINTLPSEEPPPQRQVEESESSASSDPLRSKLVELLQKHGPLSVTEAHHLEPGSDWGQIAWHLHMLNLLSIINWPAPPQVSRRSDFRYTVRT